MSDDQLKNAMYDNPHLEDSVSPVVPNWTDVDVNDEIEPEVGDYDCED